MNRDQLDSLARDVWPSLSVYLYDRDSTRIIGRGSSFPASTDIPGGLLTEDLFYRTDLHWWCYYDLANTRWLTCHEETCILGVSDSLVGSYSAVSNNIRFGLLRSDYQPVLTRAEALIFTGATNNGTNYLTYTIADSNATVNWTFNTSGGGASANVPFNTPTFTQPTAVRTYLNLNITAVTGAPTAQSPRTPLVKYRLVIP